MANKGRNTASPTDVTRSKHGIVSMNFGLSHGWMGQCVV